MAPTNDFNDRMLSLGLARVSEAAAHASAKLIGRGDTTLADAYLSPVLRHYVDQFVGQLGEGIDPQFMKSSGGLASAAASNPGSTLALVAEIFPLSSPFAMAGRAANSSVLWPHLAALAPRRRSDFVARAYSRNLERGGVSERPKVIASKAIVG